MSNSPYTYNVPLETHLKAEERIRFLEAENERLKQGVAELAMTLNKTAEFQVAELMSERDALAETIKRLRDDQERSTNEICRMANLLDAANAKVASDNSKLENVAERDDLAAQLTALEAGQ